MIKRFLASSSLYSLSNILLAASKLVLVPVYVHYLSTEQYGLLGFVNIVTVFFSTLTFFGFDRSITREYFDYEHDEAELKAYLGNVLLFMVVLDASLFALMLIFGPWVFSTFFGDARVPFFPYIPLSLGIAGITSFYGIFMVLLQVRQQALTYAVIQVMKFALGTTITILFVVVWHFDAKGVLLGDLIGTGIMSVALMYLLAKTYSLGRKGKSGFSEGDRVGGHKKDMWPIFSRTIRQSLAYGAPFILLDLGNWLGSGVGRVILSKYRSLEEVGLYTLGDTLAFGLNMVMSAFYTAYLPTFFKTAKESQDPQKEFSMMSSIYVLVIGGACLFGIMFSTEIIHLIAPPVYKNASPLMRVLVVAMFFLGLYNIVAVPLLYLKETKILPFFVFASAVINVSMNFVLVPSMGMMGVAWAKMAAQVFMFGIAFWVASKRNFTKYSFGPFWGIIALVVVCGFLFNSQQLIIRILVVLVFLAFGAFVNYKQFFCKAKI